MDQLGSRTTEEDLTVVRDRLKRRPLDYFKQFYGDTAVFGSAAATRCGLEFFGPERVLFASDSPFDPEQGPGFIRETIRVLDRDLDLPARSGPSFTRGTRAGCSGWRCGTIVR